MRTAKEVRPIILRIFRAMGHDRKKLICVDVVGHAYQVTRDDGYVASIQKADINDYMASGNTEIIIQAKTNIENALKKFERPDVENTVLNPIS